MMKLYYVIPAVLLVSWVAFVTTSPLHHQVEKRSLKLSLKCLACESAIVFFRKILKSNPQSSLIGEIIKEACIHFYIESRKVCADVVKEFQPETLYVLSKSNLTEKEICSTILNIQCTYEGDPYNKWSISLPNTPKPPVRPIPVPKSGAPKLRCLHLTDIHLDTMYQEGANAKCGEPLCCRKSNGPPAKAADGAGKWGDYRNCDLPPRTMDNLFNHLRNIQDQFDYIIWTGDLPPHNIWNQSRSDQTKVINILTQYFLKYLPNKPMFPVVGNHESSPVNSFPPHYIYGNNSINWLYSALKESWSNWLPETTYSTISNGAFYTVSPYPGFRIVSLNTNYCNNLNWWLLINMTDPNNELSWLINVLQKAEDKKEKVHIIGHIPPGCNDCLKAWSNNYYKIISRYESTVAAQFFGHTHMDSFEMFYDVSDMKRPVSIAYIAGSITPYILNKAVNPSYRIYDIDGPYPTSSWAVLNHQNYLLNLTAANINDNPVWQKEYSAKETYNLPNLNPDSWNNLIKIMGKNATILQLFNKYKFKSVNNGECSGSCRHDLLCELRSGRSHDPSLCKNL
ncbi:sphingomyelin phosphodiesterase isoform X2 [Octopus bimaculoides]|uniref:sphingomyelin phosphodiesterase isoform X2 n=1 Tax=Octopus bimaculoides TaxID=37653 RepID=UPI00071D8A71|nr:sphingomyelin phosphodiesterase isoform X2 [Octopus bimaculoides]|eukprot:XP_014786628.1 PREDICTED: sphingomyelin phosphodiesterase-like [Octopus bimaculoides]